MSCPSFVFSDDEEITEEFDATEVGSRKAVLDFLDALPTHPGETLPPPPEEDTIPG